MQDDILEENVAETPHKMPYIEVDGEGQRFEEVTSGRRPILATAFPFDVQCD